MLGRFRDFDAAEQWMDRAEKTDPNRAWIAVARAHLFELEDRYAEALASAQHALSQRPRRRNLPFSYLALWHKLPASTNRRRPRPCPAPACTPTSRKLPSLSRYWGQTGYYLSAVRADALTVEWFGNRRERTDLKPWMLLNLGVSLRRLKKDDEARWVSEAALKLPADDWSPLHALWLAADAALAGNSEQARELLNRSNRDKLVNYYKFLRDLVGILLDYQKLSEERRAAEFSRTWSRLASLRRTFFGNQQRVGWGDPALMRVYVQCAMRMDKLGGTFWTRMRAGVHCVSMR